MQVPAAIDLRQQRFGRLVALSYVAGNRLNRRSHWRCRCDCGTEVEVSTQLLRNGKTQSCGCLRSEGVAAKNHRHGLAGDSPEYRCWKHIIQRCHNPTNKAFPDYGGRGIVVCDQWRHDFPAFLAHIGKRPSALHSIDRIDNDGHYEPGNVRWAMRETQVNNRRGVHLVTWNGRTQSISQWAHERGLPYQTLKYRLQHGWSLEQALTRGCNSSS